MISKDKKREIIKELEEDLGEATALYFSSINGVKTSQLNNYKAKLKEVGGKAKVIKKTLLDLALKRKGLKEDWREKLEGSVLVNFAFEDPLAPAKIVKEFSKQNENFKIIGGLLNNEFLTASVVEELANIPAKNVLYGRLAGAVYSPFYRLAYSLKSNLFRLAMVINAIGKQSVGKQ
ncbi:MAG TPA: 50S ribosomal protein L10 [Candidatus Paceibacterota bacterium]|nr:50S ribosomal protein L10 [Candidatus Paceibacterota bacterium]